MSDGLFERLDRIEKLLIELVELARKNWGPDEETRTKETRRLKKPWKDESAPDLGDVWEMEKWSDPNELYAQDDKDPYEGMYDESGEDPLERFYETEETKTPEVKKGEIKRKRVPQKGKVVKRDRSEGAPDW